MAMLLCGGVIRLLCHVAVPRRVRVTQGGAAALLLAMVCPFLTRSWPSLPQGPGSCRQAAAAGVRAGAERQPAV